MRAARSRCRPSRKAIPFGNTDRVVAEVAGSGADGMTKPREQTRTTPKWIVAWSVRLERKPGPFSAADALGVCRARILTISLTRPDGALERAQNKEILGRRRCRIHPRRADRKSVV